MNSKLKFKVQNFYGPILIIIIAVILRLIPHPPNFAPIGAMALFGGAYFDKKYAIIILLVALLVSDVFLGFHSTMLYVYASFILTGIIGLRVSKQKTPITILIASIISSVAFYVITNFGVWLSTDLYPKTITGLAESYILALPFFRNTLIGDLFYTVLLFSGYELMVKYINYVFLLRLDAKR